MADQDARFSIELDADSLKAGADSGADSLEKIKASIITGGTRALAEMQRAMKNLGTVTPQNEKQFKSLKAAIDVKKAGIAQAQAAYIGLGGTFGKTGKGTASFKDRLSELGKQARGMPGPLGAMLGKFEEFSKLVGGGKMAVGILGVGAALTLLVAATVKATAALYSFGVAQADARRTEFLHIQGLTQLRNWFGFAAGNAKELQAGIDQVSASSSLSRDKITELNEQLYRGGLRGDVLAKSLKLVSDVSAVQGSGQASFVASMAIGFGRATGSVDKLAARYSRVSETAKEMTLSASVQAQKLQESYAQLFSGLDIQKLLSVKKDLNDMFSQSTASGRALKQLLTFLFQPFVNAEAAATPVLRRFFQGLIISALDFEAIVLKVAIFAVKNFGFLIPKSIDTTTIATKTGEAAFWVLGTALLTAGVLTVGLSIKLTTILVPAMVRATAASIKFAFSGLRMVTTGLFRMAAAAWSAAPAIWATVAPMLPFIVAALAVSAAIYELYTNWDELKQAFKDLNWKQAGTDAIKGILSGLIPGFSLITGTLSDLGSAALDSLKKTLGIHSPSTAFAKLGLAIPQGLNVGINAGKPQVKRNVDGLVSVPSIPVGNGGTAANGGNTSSGPTISVQIGDVNIHGAADKASAIEAADTVIERITQEFQRVLAGMGAPAV